LYLGVNLEFKEVPVHQTVHAEQFLVANCLHNNEEKLQHLAVNVPPCGLCRQFLNELPDAKEMDIAISSLGVTQRLEELLPHSFGPAELGDGAQQLLQPQQHNLKLHVESAVRSSSVDVTHILQHRAFASTTCDMSVEHVALEAANQSYCPYSGCPSGVALEMSDGSVYAGAYAENAAFNPSLQPMQVMRVPGAGIGVAVVAAAVVVVVVVVAAAAAVVVAVPGVVLMTAHSFDSCVHRQRVQYCSSWPIVDVVVVPGGVVSPCDGW